jgi:MFS family permease
VTTIAAAIPARASRRHFNLSAFWFGSAFHWAVLLLIAIPADVRRLVGEENKATYLGLLIGGLALVPLLLPPLLGAISDRLGRRLAFIRVGILLDVLGLAVMFLAPSYWLYFLGFFLVQVGNNTATGPYMALIPDVVPERERGASSGAMGLLQVGGQLAGFAAAFALSGNRLALFAIVAAMLVGSALITLLTTSEPQRAANAPRPRASWGVYFRRPYANFRWVFVTRALWEFGRACVQPYLLFYLADVIVAFRAGPLTLASESQALALLLALIAITGALTALFGGRLSDRVGKKPVIYVAGFFMTAAVLSFAMAGTYSLVLASGLLFGLGYGAYLSVDWALGAAVLPDPAGYARDMGVWHVAMVFPQLLDSLVGRSLDAANANAANSGYTMLFAIAGLSFVLATAFVSRVRGVR